MSTLLDFRRLNEIALSELDRVSLKSEVRLQFEQLKHETFHAFCEEQEVTPREVLNRTFPGHIRLGKETLHKFRTLEEWLEYNFPDASWKYFKSG